MKKGMLALVAMGLTTGAWAGEAAQVEKCERELGTLAVAEPQDHVISSLGHYKLGSPSVMLRMLAQESGCFAVVERGVAMQNLQQERALANSGQLQGGSNIGGGQLQAADFVMTPAVQFSGDTGGVGGYVGGLLHRLPGGGLLSSVSGGVSFKEAETSLLVADVRSGLQVASAEGKATKMNFSLSSWGWTGLGWASAGGYTKTPEGKLIAASLLDNYNRIVAQIRSKPQLIRQTSVASQNNAANSLPATGTAPAAQQPQVVASPPPGAPSTSTALPAAMVGAFSGQFSGAEQGVFSVIVAADGKVSGVGQSSTSGGFQISGVMSSSGQVVMLGSGQAGAAQFSGTLDPRSGALAGSWQLAGGKAQGVFNGKRM